jgi:hypothetical protein
VFSPLRGTQSAEGPGGGPGSVVDGRPSGTVGQCDDGEKGAEVRCEQLARDLLLILTLGEHDEATTVTRPVLSTVVYAKLPDTAVAVAPDRLTRSLTDPLCAVRRTPLKLPSEGQPAHHREQRKARLV